mgnify:CR=1 FL=1|tara:strand:- start:190 stop:921 length:732 start_codon:yes stop_codon:yes gene_type:complete
MPQSQTALITGAAHRIGQALCLALHQIGFDVAIHCHHSNVAANTLALSLNRARPDSAKTFQADLTQSNAVKQCCFDVIEWRPSLSVLINNASMFVDDNSAQEKWDNLFNCNVKAPYLLSNYCFETLKENNGCIINLTDIYAKFPLTNYGVYCMTKAALESQTKQLAKQFSPHVRVNAIAPGAILWPKNSNELSDDIKQKLINNTPLKRIGGTKPIIHAALHFIENTFLTGISINVDGGRSLKN